MGEYRGTITSTSSPDLLYTRIMGDKVNKKVSLIKEGGHARLLLIDVLPSKQHMASNRKIWATWLESIGMRMSNRTIFREPMGDQPLTFNDILASSTRLDEWNELGYVTLPYVAYRETKVKEFYS